MKRILILLFVISVFACLLSDSLKGGGTEAERLNNQAVNLLYNNPDISTGEKLQNSIKLLDSAIKADSGYFKAYWNKFRFQNDLKRYHDASVTGKQMIRLRPDDAHVKIELGMVYEKMNDTAASFSYFKDALRICDRKLKLESVKTGVKEDGAIAMIMLNKQPQGYSILKNLYNKEKNPNYKQHLLLLMNMSRQELIYGKDDTIVSF